MSDAFNVISAQRPKTAADAFEKKPDPVQAPDVMAAQMRPAPAPAAGVAQNEPPAQVPIPSEPQSVTDRAMSVLSGIQPVDQEPYFQNRGAPIDFKARDAMMADPYLYNSPREVLLRAGISSSDSKDPPAEYYKYLNAIQYSRLYGINPDEAYMRLDEFNERFLGLSPSMDYKKTWQAVGDTFSAASIELKTAKDVNAMRMANKTDAEILEATKESRAEIARLRGDSIKGDFGREILKGIGGSIPQMAAAGAAGAMGASVGFLGGPATTASMATIFSFMENQQIRQGIGYLRLIESGTDSKTAGYITALGSSAGAAIETLLGTNKSVVNAISKVTQTKLAGSIANGMMVGNRVLPTIGNLVVRIGKNGLEEGTQESIDQAIEEVSTLVAYDMTKSSTLDRPTALSAASNIGQAFVIGGIIGGIMGVPPEFINWKADISQAKALRDFASVTDRDTFVKEAVKSDVLAGTPEQKEERAAQIFDDTRAEAILRKSDAQVATGKVEETAPDQKPVARTAEGTIRSSSYAKNRDENDRTITYGNEGPGDLGFANVEIEVDDNAKVILVNDADIDEGYDFVSDEIARDVMSKYPGYTFSVSSTADPRIQGAFMRVEQSNGIPSVVFEQPVDIPGTIDSTNGETIDLEPENLDYDEAEMLAEQADGEVDTETRRGAQPPLKARNPLIKYPDSNKKTVTATTPSDRLDVWTQYQKSEPKSTPVERDLFVSLMEMEANARGLSLGEMVSADYDADKIFKQVDSGTLPKGKISAAMISKVGNQVKTMIYLTEKSDFNSVIHEYAHGVRQRLSSPDRTILEAKYEVKEGSWSRKQEERFVDDLRDFIVEGKIADEKLRDLFTRIAEFLKKLWKQVLSRGDVDPEIRAVFEKLFASEPNENVVADNSIPGPEGEVESRLFESGNGAFEEWVDGADVVEDASIVREGFDYGSAYIEVGEKYKDPGFVSDFVPAQDLYVSKNGVYPKAGKELIEATESYYKDSIRNIDGQGSSQEEFDKVDAEMREMDITFETMTAEDEQAMWDKGLFPVNKDKRREILIKEEQRGMLQEKLERRLQIVQEIQAKAEEYDNKTNKQQFKTGEPVVAKVYHGSKSSDIDFFDEGMLGTATGAKSARMGHFFAGNINTSRPYAKAESSSPSQTKWLHNLLKDPDKTSEYMGKLNDILYEIQSKRADLADTIHDIRDKRGDIAPKLAKELGWTVRTSNKQSVKDDYYHYTVEVIDSHGNVLDKRTNATIRDSEYDSDLQYRMDSVSYTYSIRDAAGIDSDEQKAANKEMLDAMDREFPGIEEEYKNAKDKDYELMLKYNAVNQGTSTGEKIVAEALGYTDWSGELNENNEGMYELWIRLENPKVVDWGGAAWTFNSEVHKKGWADTIQEAKDEGYDGIILTNAVDGGPLDNIFVKFDGWNVKDATGRNVTFDKNEKRILYQGEEELVDSVDDASENVEEDYNPKKTGIGYKLFDYIDGKLYPLFLGAKKETPVGKWIKAEVNSKKGFAQRPGWHLGSDTPDAPWLKNVNGEYTSKKGPKYKRVWAKVEYPMDVDYQPEADQSPSRDLPGKIPEDGYYKFKEGSRGTWVISGAIKVKEIISEEERSKILKDIGYDQQAAFAPYQASMTKRLDTIRNKKSEQTILYQDSDEAVADATPYNSFEEYVKKTTGDEIKDIPAEDLEILKATWANAHKVKTKVELKPRVPLETAISRSRLESLAAWSSDRKLSEKILAGKVTVEGMASAMEGIESKLYTAKAKLESLAKDKKELKEYFDQSVKDIDALQERIESDEALIDRVKTRAKEKLIVQGMLDQAEGKKALDDYKALVAEREAMKKVNREIKRIRKFLLSDPAHKVSADFKSGISLIQNYLLTNENKLRREQGKKELDAAVISLSEGDGIFTKADLRSAADQAYEPLKLSREQVLASVSSLVRNQPALAESFMKVFEDMADSPLSDWTLDEMMKAKEIMKDIIKIGKYEQSIIDTANRMRQSSLRALVIQNLKMSKRYDPEKEYTIPTSEEDRLMAKGFDPTAMMMSLMRIKQFAREYLDNGKDGVSVDVLYNQVMEGERQRITNAIRRKAKLVAASKDMKRSELQKVHSLPELGMSVTTEKLMGWLALAGSKDASNKRQRDALAYGILVGDAAVKDGMTEEEIVEEGDRKFKIAMDYVDKILTKEQKDMVNLALDIMNDKNDVERFRKVIADMTGENIVEEPYYFPLNRIGAYVEGEDSVIDAFKRNQKEITSLAESGMSISRVDMSAKAQKPVRTDFFNVVFDAIDTQERLIAHGQRIVDLHKIYLDKVTKAVTNKAGGVEITNYLTGFMNELARPTEFVKLEGSDRMLAGLRGKAIAVSYLGGRVTSVMKQLITSPMPFIAYAPADTVVAAVKAYSSFMHGESPVAWYKAREEKSAVLKDRQIDTYQKGLKRMDDAGLEGKMKRMGELSLRGLEFADRFTVAMGWEAVYQKTLRDTRTEEMPAGNEQLAIRKADDAVIQTQPSGEGIYLAPAYRNRNQAQLAFMQFTSSLNVVYNNLLYDVPSYIKNKQVAKGLGLVISYALAGAGLGVMDELRRQLRGDERKGGSEEVAKRIAYSAATGQAFDSIYGWGEVVDGLTKNILFGDTPYGYDVGIPFLGSVAKSAGKVASVAKDVRESGYIDEEKIWPMVSSILESGGLAVGAPVYAAKDIEELAKIVYNLSGNDQ